MRRQTPRLVALLATAATAVQGQVLPGEEAEPRRLSGARVPLPAPILSPSALEPGQGAVRLAVGAILPADPGNPDVLSLEEVSRSGEPIAVRAELRDDGRPPDRRAGDGRYAGRFEAGADEETELFFRLRAGDASPSEPVALPVSTIPLGLAAVDADTLVALPDGGAEAFADQLMVRALPGTPPDRIRALVEQVGAALSLPGSRVDGFLPRLRLYSVRLVPVPPAAQLRGIVEAFEAEREIVHAALNLRTLPAAQTHLQNVGIETLWSQGDAVSGIQGAIPGIHGGREHGIALIDENFDCGDPSGGTLSCASADLDGRCDAAPDPVACAAASRVCSCVEDPWTDAGLPRPGNCSGYAGADTSAASIHGTKILHLIGGAQGSPAFRGIDEGVAWDAPIYPFRADGGSTLELTNAIDCISGDAAGSQALSAPIISFSRVAPPATDPDDLRDTICAASCRGILFVTAAGNGGCFGNDAIDTYPALFGEDPTACSCGSPVRERVLSVGGVNAALGIGDTCSVSPPRRSQRGEIFAQGWDIPDSSGATHGTTWATPVVSGCAAVLGATWDARQPGSWDAKAAADQLLASAKVLDLGTPDVADDVRLLDCAAAVLSYDVGFVLDRSGSMGWPASDASTETRWEVLGRAADGFGGLLETTAPRSSRFGLTLFSTNVLVDPIAGLAPIAGGIGSDLDAALGQVPAGATAMGAGLESGRGELSDARRPRAIVLFTDGEQNQKPEITSDGCGLDDGTSFYPTCATDPAAQPPPGNPRIVTIGILQPSSDHLATLTNLAARNGGTALITTDAGSFTQASDCDDTDPDPTNDCAVLTGIDEAFEAAVAPALRGASPQVVASYRGRLLREGRFGPFEVNRGVSRLVLSIALPRRLEAPALNALASRFRIRRDGDDVTRHFSPHVSGSGGGSVRLVSAGDGGTLPLEGVYEVDYAPAVRREDLPLRLVVYADDHRLDMEWGVAPIAPRTQATFEPTLGLRWRGEAIEGAKVRARILRPGDDLGDLLAREDADVDLSTAPDAGTPGAQKYFHLLGDEDFVDRLRAKATDVVLSHRGDGRYSAKVDPGEVSGVYQILYRVRAEDPAFGVVERVAVQSAYVRFSDVDWDASFLGSSRTPSGIAWRIRPVAVYGRFVGPGQERAIHIEGDVEVRRIVDHLDGSYTIEIDGERSAPVIFSLLDEVVYEGPLEPIAPCRPWLWIALVLIAIAAFLWLRRRSAA